MKKLLKLLRLNEQTISMILGILVVVVVGILVVNFFKNRQQPPLTSVSEEKQEEKEEKISLEESPGSYTVQPGDNLWKIAEKFYGSGYNWVDIAKENKLRNPNMIVPGQQLNLPKVEVKKPTPPEETKGTKFGEAITGDSYTVAKGDHLWGIAVRAYGDGYQWVKIARENKLANPNLIHRGNVLRIPR